MPLLGDVIVILGATAVGKTKLALDLAEALNGEIVGADSRQIYRYMDIGTAKPTPAQRARVPHHLVDVATPDSTLSLAQIQDLAYSAFDQIHQRGKLPFLVGGTGQYLTAICEGWTIPRVPPQAELRAELEAFAQAQGAQALHARLAQLDPEYAARTHPNNVRRVIRALEVCLTSGERMSQQQQQRSLPYRFLKFGLTLEREELYSRADQRVQQMMAEGFLDEVRLLLQLGYECHLPAMSAVGYAELCAHLLDGIALDDALERICFNTHDFIRRQEVWFRKHEPATMWHNSKDIHFSTLMTHIATWRGTA